MHLIISSCGRGRKWGKNTNCKFYLARIRDCSVEINDLMIIGFSGVILYKYLLLKIFIVILFFDVCVFRIETGIKIS